MSSEPLRSTASPELFDRLIDDAAVFPPGNAPLPEAVPAHIDYRATPYADLVGPFLCPASRLDDLPSTFDDTVLDVRVVVDTGTGGLADAVAVLTRNDGDAAYLEHGYEIPLRAETDLGTAARRLVANLQASDIPPGETVFVEVPRGPSAYAALDVLAEDDLLAKLRTGGADHAAHPTEHEVADFLLACLDREIGFKLTAGLHHAVRHTETASGFEQHGFLNVLLAVHAALDGADRREVAAVLAQRDADLVAEQIRGIQADDARRIRRWFRSYGSCSITEPVDELITLGLFAPGGPTSPAERAGVPSGTEPYGSNLTLDLTRDSG